jgi:cation diffusion facilitator family transporter
MTKDLQNEKSAVAWLSVVSNTTLVLLKCAVGLMIGSVAVISEGIHSAVDLVAALIALFAVKKSGKPADKDHPFGHGKVENISGTVEAILIFFAAAWIIYEAVHKLMHPAPMEAAGWGVAVMLLSTVANTIVSQRLFRVGRKSESAALLADAWHLRTDVYTSAGVLGGLLFIWIGRWLLPGVDLQWLDPVAAIAVALLIFKAAYDLTLEAGRDLLDAKLPEGEEQLIRDHLAEFFPTIRGVHRFRTRKSGQIRFVEFHMRVDGTMTVNQAHDLSHQIANAIEEHFPGTNINIHVEPAKEPPSPARPQPMVE